MFAPNVNIMPLASTCILISLLLFKLVNLAPNGRISYSNFSTYSALNHILWVGGGGAVKFPYARGRKLRSKILKKKKKKKGKLLEKSYSHFSTRYLPSLIKATNISRKYYFCLSTIIKFVKLNILLIFLFL